MATWIYLVRHGQTTWNAEGRFCGCGSDIPLNDEGHWQAHQLAERLKEVPFTAIYSSPLLRAYQTAEVIAAVHRLSIRIAPDLREMDYGEWEGMKVEEMESKFPDAERRRREDPMNFAAPKGERFADFTKRVIAAMQRIPDSHKGETICVVAHQGVNRVVLCWVLQADFSLWRRLRQDSACVNLFQVRDDGLWRLVTANDTCHLSN